MTLLEAGTAAYAACVDVELYLARVSGTTYRDVNAALFFVVFPALTVVLGAVALAQARARRSARRTR